MEYYEEYDSPLGKITLISDGESLTGLYFENQKNFPNLKKYKKEEKEIFRAVKKYLEEYFRGNNPKVSFPLKKTGTPFQQQVQEELLKTPYGKTRTYKDITIEIAKKRKLKSMSTQAVGSAIGKNTISIIIPCHRVIGTDKRLVGYAGGLDRKRALLEIEGHKKEEFKEKL